MNHFHPFISTLFFCILSSVLSGQQLRDSLVSVWKDEHRPPKERLQALDDLCWDVFMYNDADSSFHYARILYDLARQNKDSIYWVKSLENMGSSRALRSEYDSALHYYHQLIDLKRSWGKEPGASVFNNMGAIYYYQGNYPMAMEQYQQSLAIYEKKNNLKGQLSPLNNLGLIYKNQGNIEKALEYFNRCIAIAEKVEDYRSMANAFCNIGIIEDDRGADSLALSYYERSISAAEKVGDEAIRMNNLENMAGIYFDNGQHEEALRIFYDVLAFWEEYEDAGSIANILSSIGEAYILSGKWEKAKAACQRGLKLAQEVESWTYQEPNCRCMYVASKNEGNTAEALKYHELLLVIQDSIFNEANTEKITRMEMQYDFDKKQLAVQAEQEKKEALSQQEIRRQKLMRNGFMGGFAIVLAFAGVFFRQRNRINREKKRSEDLLLNILPHEVAEELKEKGSAEATLFEQATVLFTDFKGFTAISEKLSPKELVDEIHECFSAFDEIMQRYGVEKIKTIGDAYMAVGGLPVARDSHARDVLQAAMDIRDFMLAEAEKRKAQGRPYFEIRIGVNSGSVVAGIVGVKKFQYDIWGDTVNTAARMENSGTPGKVNISESTYALVKDDPDFSFEARGMVEAKGKGKVGMYYIERN